MKKKIKIDFDAPVTVLFVFISIAMFAVDFFTKGKLSGAFLSSPTAGGEFPFVPSDVVSYLRLFFYAFGAVSWEALITNLLFILLLGPAMEDRYGSVIIAIMMIVSTLFSGVLNACFCSESLKGCISIVFMMIFLNSFMSFSKKKVPLSFMLIFILFIVKEICSKNANGAVGIFVGLAGGLCGSLFAFLASPKAKAERKNQKTDEVSNAELISQIDGESPRFKKKGFWGGKSDAGGTGGKKSAASKASDYSTNEEEVIGTLDF